MVLPPTISMNKQSREKKNPMQISLIAFFGPDGSREYVTSTLSNDEWESLITTGVSSIANKLLDQPGSPLLGLIHRSVNVQLYAFVSCTGWVLMIGLEPGPYDSDQVARSLLERAYSVIVEVSLNPFYTCLRDSAMFEQMISSTVQSHTVMMKFMASSQIS